MARPVRPHLTGNDRLDTLSHGNQQRVQLIAALVNEPDLIVLDEPFSGLDPLAITNMSELLTDVAGAGATVLFSSHQLDLVEHLCEDVVIIDHGRIVLAGDLEELRAAVPDRFVDIAYRGAGPDWTTVPDTTWARLISWLPITAPIAMPTRIAMGAAAWREPALAAALTTATIAGLVVVGGRVYTAAVLPNGPTLKLRDTGQHSRAPPR